MSNSISNELKKISSSNINPTEIIAKMPKITVVGMNEITIENHRGIKRFSDNLIEVNSKIGSIKISGINFEILYIGSYTIIISGVFKSIKYEDDIYGK